MTSIEIILAANDVRRWMVEDGSARGTGISCDWPNANG